ncbi:MAG: NAD(P)/FAD-dependent oxidoreductase [Bacteroidales bacterium]|nr:NAD(P)/FAD-dependent oxidoreductase [Bacteroidales bacterium]
MNKPVKRERTAVIIGAGPAGLTAAYELITRAGIRPIVLEQDAQPGGISRTVNHKGNRIDIGGHRFFSKSDRVMQWWLDILPLQKLPEGAGGEIAYQGKKRGLAIPQEGGDPDQEDRLMLLRKRVSRILYLRKFFDYPVTLNLNTIRNLGLIRIIRIVAGYLWVKLFPVRKEKSLEDFMINRFGGELYRTFFRDYTEKVWGVPCREIPSEWGAQRIKGLSVSKVIGNAVSSILKKDKSISQKEKETSLIEQFLYPKYGPGQMWEETARRVTEQGGEVLCRHRVTGLQVSGNTITGVKAIHLETGEELSFRAGYIFSSMPVRDLIRAMDTPVPDPVREVAEGLVYRDFITVGLLLKKLRVASVDGRLIPDCWIYVQERDVKIGRIQLFNNWSPYMVADPDTVWIGLEYFCNEGDDVWRMKDADLVRFAVDELARIGFIGSEDYLDGLVIRMPKTYPAYFGTYDRFDVVRQYLDGFGNLFLIGRNGMHKYNNQDHSMLTAMTAVDHIIAGTVDKESIWNINTEQEYHESK